MRAVQSLLCSSPGLKGTLPLKLKTFPRRVLLYFSSVAECQAVESHNMLQLSLFLVVIAGLSEKIYQ